MKKAIISLVLAMMSVAGYAQSVVGKWVTEGGDSQVEIYQSGDKLNGKIVWLKKGDGQLDVHNPDKKLQSRKLVGVNILTGLTKKGDKWEGGKIYNPKNGKTYKCSIWLEGNNLKVRGYVAMFYETQTWTKKKTYLTDSVSNETSKFIRHEETYHSIVVWNSGAPVSCSVDNGTARKQRFHHQRHCFFLQERHLILSIPRP